MRFFETLSRRWSGLSLALQFLIAGGFGLLAVMLVVGFWVTSQIRQGVIRNSAATTALYVDSVIAPLLPDMRKSQELGDTVKRALDETLARARSASGWPRSSCGGAMARCSMRRMRR